MLRGVLLRTASGRGAAARWRSQYQHPVHGWDRTAQGPANEVYERLCRLGEAPSAADTAHVIGNKSWSYLTCIGCNEYVEQAVEFTGSYHEGETLLCAPCVELAHALLSDSQHSIHPAESSENG